MVGFCTRGTFNEKTKGFCVIVYQLAGLQTIAAIIIVLGWWWIRGLMEGLSVFLGGITCLLPNLCFAYRLFDIINTKVGKRIAINFFYIEGLIKFALSASLVIMAILCTPISIKPFIIGYIGSQLGLWFVPLMIKSVQYNVRDSK
ncbi:ATP synthase subunit I [Coxiella endosymbiont of Amblyomma americanum]|uniref:ATP synthase subunit I n=1 Tax=Coxiella endosymbiont of Amblyomma americanum TaxID=325775 RepID=UPI000691E898|nr:ATP synthase subunit I [Coxiella endosymbiont of Amblyomma americanum]